MFLNSVTTPERMLHAHDRISERRNRPENSLRTKRCTIWGRWGIFNTFEIILQFKINGKNKEQAASLRSNNIN